MVTQLAGWKDEMIPKQVPQGAKMFLTGMVMSGIGDGIIMTIAQLYFLSIGISGADFASVFMLKALGTALVTIPAGFLADRFGKRKVLITGFSFFSFGIVGLLTTRSMALLKVYAVLLGLADATHVVLGPLYSSFFTHDEMDRAFGFKGFLSIISISFGSMMGVIPPMLVNRWGFSYTNAYWSLFAVAVVFFIARLPFFLMASRDINGSNLGTGLVLSRESRKTLAKFLALSAISLVGYEVFFSFFPLFLKTKFKAESDALGVLFTLSWAASAVANIVSPRISSKLGTVNTISLAFLLSVPLYLGMAWAPSISVLGVLYLVRRGIANLAAPLNSSLFMKMIKDEEKATASGVMMTTQKLGLAFSTWLGGWLITNQSIDAPVYVGTFLYIVYSVAMYLMFRGVETSTPVTEIMMEIKNDD